MAITPLVKSVIVNDSDADSAIQTAVQALATFNTIQGVSTMVLSNTKVRVIIIYT